MQFNLITDSYRYEFSVLLDSPLRDPAMTTRLKDAIQRLFLLALKENTEIDQIKDYMMERVAVDVNPILSPNRIVAFESIEKNTVGE